MNKKKVILGTGILVVLIVAMTLVWTKFREKPVEGSKAITIEVINAKEESKVYELNTDAQFLKEAMDEAEGLAYTLEDGMVLAINGEQAVWAEDHAYWAINVNGAYGQLGISEQPIEDGDEFEFVYTKAE